MYQVSPLAWVLPGQHPPVWARITIAVLAAVPFIMHSGAGTTAIAATGRNWLSHLPGNLLRPGTGPVPRAGRFPNRLPEQDPGPVNGRRGHRAVRMALPPASAGTPPRIARGTGAMVHTQIEDWLSGAIATGRFAPGDKLPAEQDLARWFGVSRMTLRHALGELARRGLVTRSVGRGGGTFVAEPKLEQDLTTLAGFSEQLRRNGVTPGARVLAAAEYPAGPATAAALGISEGDRVYGVRRIRLADGKPIVLEHSRFPAARFPGMLQCRLDGSLYELLEVRYGQRPHHARERLEPVTATVREAEALAVAEGALLMLVERTAYSRSGQPLEFARDLFRGDRTRMVVWTSELTAPL